MIETSVIDPVHAAAACGEVFCTCERIGDGGIITFPSLSYSNRAFQQSPSALKISVKGTCFQSFSQDLLDAPDEVSLLR